MTQSDDYVREAHEDEDLIDVDPNKDTETPEDADDKILEGEDATDVDAIHEAAFGDEDEDTIGNEINKDEIAEIKPLTSQEQNKK